MSTASRGRFNIQVNSDLNAYSVDDDALAYVLVELTPDFRSDSVLSARAPVDIALVLDVSASMDQPKKYPLLRLAVDTLIASLAPEDHLALILFSQSSHLLSPLVSPEVLRQRREPLLDDMDRSPVTFGETTNLAPGLLHAFEQFGGLGRASAIRRVYCLTDGELHDAGRCLPILRALREQRAEIHIYGFGEEFNPDQLSELVGRTPGSYVKPLVDTQQVSGTFSHLAHRAANSVARDLTIRFDLASDVVCGDLFQLRPQEKWLESLQKTGNHVFVPSVEHGRSYSFLLEVRLPLCEQPCFTSVGAIEVRCTVGSTDETHTQFEELRIAREPAHGSSVPRVMLARDLLLGLRDGDPAAQLKRVEARLELCRVEKRDPALIAALERQLLLLKHAERHAAPAMTDLAEDDLDFDTDLDGVPAPPKPSVPPTLNRTDHLYINTVSSTLVGTNPSVGPVVGAYPAAPSRPDHLGIDTPTGTLSFDDLPTPVPSRQVPSPPAPLQEPPATSVPASKGVFSWIRGVVGKR